VGVGLVDWVAVADLDAGHRQRPPYLTMPVHCVLRSSDALPRGESTEGGVVKPSEGSHPPGPCPSAQQAWAGRQTFHCGDIDPCRTKRAAATLLHATILGHPPPYVGVSRGPSVVCWLSYSSCSLPGLAAATTLAACYWLCRAVASARSTFPRGTSPLAVLIASPPHRLRP
jgi:hypothetical protein